MESEPVRTQPGAELAIGADRVTVPAGGEAIVDVLLRVDPFLWVDPVDPTSSAEIQGRPRGVPGEAGGRVWFRGGGQDLQVPWHGMIRPGGRQTAGAPAVGTPPGAVVTVPLGTRGETPVADPRVGCSSWAACIRPSG